MPYLGTQAAVGFSKTTKDRLGGIDNDEYRKQEKIILEQFEKDQESENSFE